MPFTGKHYADPELLEINTLENAIYMSMKNDVSFLIDGRLSLYEHQSTKNPNLPLRFLLYISHLYSRLTVKRIFTVRRSCGSRHRSLLFSIMGRMKCRNVSCETVGYVQCEGEKTETGAGSHASEYIRDQ